MQINMQISRKCELSWETVSSHELVPLSGIKWLQPEESVVTFQDEVDPTTDTQVSWIKLPEYRDSTDENKRLCKICKNTHSNNEVFSCGKFTTDCVFEASHTFPCLLPPLLQIVSILFVKMCFIRKMTKTWKDALKAQCDAKFALAIFRNDNMCVYPVTNLPWKWEKVHS